MKADTQHLDFLISQYVDGSMDTTSRKSIEQQLVNDPAARKLYADHRDVQDLLDDMGNRIPLINWNDFDKTLANRLEKVTVGGERGAFLRRWARPLAAAAALFIAASLGYSWHAWWSPTHSGSPDMIAAIRPQVSSMNVSFPDMARQTQPSASHVIVDDAQASLAPSAVEKTVAISPPEDSFATESFRESMRIGLLGLPESVQPQQRAIGVGMTHEKPSPETPELPR